MHQSRLRFLKECVISQHTYTTHTEHFFPTVRLTEFPCHYQNITNLLCKLLKITFNVNLWLCIPSLIIYFSIIWERISKMFTAHNFTYRDRETAAVVCITILRIVPNSNGNRF